ncbi:hypothetical protein VTL71DRAFT_742 [Oculimacula yallundae]|uniref:HORMA domain-containing protein n=1 Tax=Oculimacula yallundae TaxID=86028 RepID=A0ABR4D387_9HELO
MARTPSVKKVKNKPGPIKGEVVLQQAHSFELVHTAIAATLFEVIFYRKVFPSTVKWNHRFCDPHNAEVTYKSFIAGSQEPGQGKGRAWHVPIRGQREVLDKMMDHLENGIKDALSRRYLRKITLTFHVAGKTALDQSTRLESYDIGIFYGPDGVPVITTDIRDSEPPEDKSIDVYEAKSRLKAMLYGVADHFMIPAVMKELQMRPLPENIRMVIEMEYMDETPQDYQPRGFPRITEVVWTDETEALDGGTVEFKTGFHGVAFACSLPKNNDPFPKAPQTKDFLHNSGASNSRSEELPSAVASRPSVGRHRNRSLFSVSDGDDTQSIVINEAQEVYRRISRRDGSTMLDTQQNQTSPLPSENIVSYPRYNQSAKFMIPDYRHEVREYAESKLKDREPIDAGPLHSLQSQDINCECGSIKHDGHMIECFECLKFHHAECYGYRTNPPETEFCYTCLVQSDHDRLRALKLDCQLRRIIRLFQKSSNWNALKEVATHLGLDTRLETDKVHTGLLLEDLVGEGYIEDKSGHKSQELTENSTFIQVAGMEAQISLKLFNPRSGLDEYFTIVEAPLLEGSELSDHRWPFGVPHTPRASGNILMRGMQHSSQKVFFVDNGSTRTSVSPSTHLSSRGSRQRFMTDGVETIEIDYNNVGQQKMQFKASGSGFLGESSGYKRSAEGGWQERESRKMMK